MFPYYGSKTRLAKRYPTPSYNTIIEPFAGAARYSLTYWQRDVILYDSYEVIARIWKYLIQASERDILALPEFKEGDKVTDHNQLIDEERWLCGLMINSWVAYPRITCTSRGESCYRVNRKRIASELYKVRHWKIFHGSYHQIDNQTATWFIDPPYMTGGDQYKHSSQGIDYQHLGAWCQDRQGQAIVCENGTASWLPFKPLCQHLGQYKVTTETVWLKDSP